MRSWRASSPFRTVHIQCAATLMCDAHTSLSAAGRGRGVGLLLVVPSKRPGQVHTRFVFANRIPASVSSRPSSVSLSVSFSYPTVAAGQGCSHHEPPPSLLKTNDHTQSRTRSAETSVLLSNRKANLPPQIFKCGHSAPSELLVSQTNNTRSQEDWLCSVDSSPKPKCPRQRNSHSEPASQALTRSASAPLQIAPTSQAFSFVAHFRPANRRDRPARVPQDPHCAQRNQCIPGRLCGIAL